MAQRSVYTGRELEIGKVGPSHYLIEGFEVDKDGSSWRVFDGPMLVALEKTLVAAKEFIAARLEEREGFVRR